MHSQRRINQLPRRGQRARQAPKARGLLIHVACLLVKQMHSPGAKKVHQCYRWLQKGKSFAHVQECAQQRYTLTLQKTERARARA